MPSPPDVSGAATSLSVVSRVIWPFFSSSWAIAVLFHLAGNPRLAPPWGRGVLGITAIVALAGARRPPATVPLAIAVLVNVWLEAPRLGNHWLLHGFVAVVVLGAVLVGRGSVERVVAAALSPLRLTLLVFYGFAAFAKLNSDFFDPAVSCAVFYLEESTSSWGLGRGQDFPSVVGTAVAVGVVATELAIPFLVIRRTTRARGVVVALAFHWVLALDRSHQFFDFSSLLSCLFLLFLPPAVVTDVVARLRRMLRSITQRGSESAAELARLVGLAAAGLVVLVAAGPDVWPAPPLLAAIGTTTWIVGGGALVVVVAQSVASEGKDRAPPLLERLPAWRPGHIALLLLPALAVGNGLTPYLELKSGFGWNMYSNLAIVDGDSNHLVIRRGLPLTDAHARLVRIESTDDPTLTGYIGRWSLPELQLLDFLADRPGVAVGGVVDGRAVRYAGGDRASARPVWRQRFQVFRAVDLDGPVSCQPSFGPAR